MVIPLNLDIMIFQKSFHIELDLEKKEEEKKSESS